MSRFDELARLKKSIRKNRFECIGSMQEGVDFMCDAEIALPWLLAIAEAFQPGDAMLLAGMAATVSAWSVYGPEYACLKRLQAAAEEMKR